MASSLQGPALQPPPGVIPNFNNPQTLEVVDTAIMVICLAIPTIAIALRFYYKKFVLKDFGPEDWTLALGFAVYLPYSALTFYSVDFGLGRHQWDVRQADMQVFLYYMRVCTCLYCVFVTLVKISILLQYLRIFNTRAKRGFMFWSCWGLIIFLTLFYGAGLIVAIFPCTPIRKWWTVTPMEGYCINFGIAYMISGLVNTISDIIIIALPQKSIWALKLPLRKKLKVSIIFLVALFALVASVMRLYYCFKIKTSADTTWYGAILDMWTYAELMTMMFCSCMPSIVGLASHWGAKILSSHWGSKALFSLKLRTASSNSQQTRLQSQENVSAAGIGSGHYKHNILGHVSEKSASTSSEHTRACGDTDSVRSTNKGTAMNVPIVITNSDSV